MEQFDIAQLAPSKLRFVRRVAPAIAEVLARYESDVPATEIAFAIVADFERVPAARHFSAREQILRACHYRPRCWLCGFPIPLDVHSDAPEAFSIDHVIPRREGGANLGISNLKPAHRFCNSHRETKPWTKARLRKRATLLSVVAALEEFPQLSLFDVAEVA